MLNNYREKPKYKKLRLTIITCHRKRGVKELANSPEASKKPVSSPPLQDANSSRWAPIITALPFLTHYTTLRFRRFNFFSTHILISTTTTANKSPDPTPLPPPNNPRTQRNRWPKNRTARAAPRRRTRRKSCDHPRNKNRSRSRGRGHRHYHFHPRAPEETAD